MMFTLDEEDDETEYGESFQSSMKSTGKIQGKISYIKRLPQSSSEDDDDSSQDLDRQARTDFQDAGVMYQKISREEESKKMIQSKKAFEPSKNNQVVGS